MMKRPRNRTFPDLLVVLFACFSFLFALTPALSQVYKDDPCSIDLDGNGIPDDEEEGCSDTSDPPIPADAMQQHPDMSWAVAQAISELTAEGEDLLQQEDEGNNCGPGLIVERAAQILNRAGIEVGVLRKTGGNKCNNHAVDRLCFPEDGYIYDVVGGAGDADGNKPTWGADCCGEKGGEGTCAERCVPP
jgi:hypothetical protein